MNSIVSAEERTADTVDVAPLCRDLAERAKAASRALAVARTAAKNDWLKRGADALRANADEILEANALDVAAAPDFGLSAAAIDRLTLNPKRLEEVARALEAYGSGRAGFADYLIREDARENGCSAVATFDKDLLKESGFLSP